MTTPLLTTDPATPPTSRLVRLIPAAAAAVLLLAVGYIAVERYQPLERAGQVRTDSASGAVLVEDFDATGAHILRYEEGGEVTYGFAVRNEGPVGVTVTGVAAPAVEQRRLLQPRALQPPQPFALAPGETRDVVVVAQFGNCEYYTERAVERIEQTALTFRVAGVPRTAALSLDRPLLVKSPTIQRCSERTLDRSEHQRGD